MEPINKGSELTKIFVGVVGDERRYAEVIASGR
jgi:hypothetical protein